MDSIKFSEFLYERISETINRQAYIKAVNIGYYKTESFGNEYIRVDYTVEVNDDFYNLPISSQQVFQLKPHYIFTLSTHAKRSGITVKKLLKILEFKSIYESLSAYAIHQLECGLPAEVEIKIQSIDFWPEGNYAERYFHTLRHPSYGYSRYNSFEYDVIQWHDLQKLTNDSKENYRKNKKQFSITDNQICELFDLSLTHIRNLIVRNYVPIKTKGIKTVDEVQIHASRFVYVLKEELKRKYFWSHNTDYRPLINYLYDNYLQSERDEIIARQKIDFLSRYLIQSGDILKLSDGRIVVAESLEINSSNAIFCTYSNLKTNLENGNRSARVLASNVIYILPQKDFQVYKEFTPSKRYSLFEKWLVKNNVEFKITNFTPDLAV